MFTADFIASNSFAGYYVADRLWRRKWTEYFPDPYSPDKSRLGSGNGAQREPDSGPERADESDGHLQRRHDQGPDQLGGLEFIQLGGR